MPQFDQVDLSGLTFLVCRIIRDVDSLPMISFSIPLVQKADPLIHRNIIQESRHLRITINFHVVSEQRMIVSVIRIILTSIILVYDRICGQIQKQPGILSNNSCKDLIQFILSYNLADYQKCTDVQASTSIPPILFRWKQFLWKELQKRFIRIHESRLFCITLSDTSPFGGIILLFF